MALHKIFPNNFLIPEIVLLVIAHPDDECMFFGPCISNFVSRGCTIYLLCLSSGGYCGQSSKRKEELRQSCKILGIPVGNVTIIEHRNLPDDPNVFWDEDVVGNIILKYVQKLSADMVISFDRQGVSGHFNHIAIYESLRYLYADGLFPEGCRVYVLETVNLFRKYSGVIDVLLSYFFSGLLFITFKETRTIKKAMKAHQSQYVWFRKLYMLFSRYVFINTLSSITDCVT